jgi:hypothetical protein
MTMQLLPLEKITYDLPLEVIRDLPLDLWKEIALMSPAAYRIMTLVCKNIVFCQDFAMRHFTRIFSDVRHFPGNEPAYRLPNGMAHSIDDIPAFTKTVDSEWVSYWCYYGKVHRDNDLPAIVYSDGDQIWYRHGVRYHDNMASVMRYKI